MATQLLLDPDIMRGMAAISLGVHAIYKWFMDGMRNIKGPDSCAAFSQAWATFSWLEPLKKTMLCLEDSAGLEEIGLTMSFGSTMLDTITERDATVVYEDARARLYHSYIVNLTQEISGSMSWWTSHYPGKMVAALSETTAYESLQALKKHARHGGTARTPPPPPRHMQSSWEHLSLSMLRLCVRMPGRVGTLAAGGDWGSHLLLYCFLSLAPRVYKHFPIVPGNG